MGDLRSFDHWLLVPLARCLSIKSVLSFTTTCFIQWIGLVARQASRPSKMKVDSDKGYIPSAVQSNSSYYYCDYFYQNQSIVAYLLLGGSSANGGNCGFACPLHNTASATSWGLSAALSFKHWGEWVLALTRVVSNYDKKRRLSYVV